jgi:hypothetical protein
MNGVYKARMSSKNNQLILGEASYCRDIWDVLEVKLVLRTKKGPNEIAEVLV